MLPWLQREFRRYNKCPKEIVSLQKLFHEKRLLNVALLYKKLRVFEEVKYNIRYANTLL
jgi:hypothetical protein